MKMVDYEGQKISEYIYVAFISAAGVIAWLIGYWKSDFQVSVYGWAIAVAMSVLLCVPDWPMYNKKPVTWLKKVGSTETDESAEVSVSKKSKNKKNKVKAAAKEEETAIAADDKAKKDGNGKRKDAKVKD